MKRTQTPSRPTDSRTLDDHDLIRAVGGELTWSGEFIHSAPWSVNDPRQTSSRTTP
jgi:hypothetical protein